MKHFIPFLLLLAFCTGCAAPIITLTNTPPSSNMTITSHPTMTPTFTLAPTITPTPDPNLPCGGVKAERIYLFLDCNDIRRIRTVYQSAEESFSDWWIVQESVNLYQSNFPASYDPDASGGVLWWGSGNFISRDMALLYLVTGKMTIAKDILRLLDLVRNNTPQVTSLSNFDSPNGRGEEYSGGLMSHPQYGAVPIQSTLFAYLSIRDTDLLDDNQRASFDSFFQQQAELLEQAAIFRGNNTPLDGNINRNVPFSANIAALTIARAFPENPAMQMLDARVWTRLEWQLANWWEKDGGWGENTQNYGFSMLESLMLLAETSLRNLELDLYSQNFDGRTIHSMCYFYLETVTPEGSTPALNDTSHYPIDPGLFNLCGFRTQDPQLYFAKRQYNAGRHLSYGVDSTSFTTPFHILTWTDIDNKPPETPNHSSVLLPFTGAAILRNGWTRDSQYALLQFTASRVHEEYSYGTLYLYSHGPWLIGNGYNIPAGQPTDQHSTLSMDNSNQSNTGGEPIAFADLGSMGIAGITSRSYPNLLHTRLLLWDEPWSQWIIVDDAASDVNQHTIQQRWYVHGIVLQKNDNVWVFSHKENSFSLSIQMLPGRSATFSQISRQYSWEEWASNANGVRMEVTYPGNPIRLITSLSTSALGSTAPAVTRVDSVNGTQIDSNVGDTTRTWILPNIGVFEGAIGDYKLTGIAGCASFQNKELIGYCLLNGSSLTYEDQTLSEGAEKIYLEADFNDGKLYIDTPTDTSIAFYWPQPIKKIADSGTELEFTIENGLVFIEVIAGQYMLDIQ